jgi:hypothetical protein
VGAALRLVNFDNLFQANQTPVKIINDISIATQIEKDEFNKEIYTRYAADDLLSNLPSCVCGKLTGEWRLKALCLNCNTRVEHRSIVELQPIVWMRAPIGVKKLINPVFWSMLTDIFSLSNFDVIRWICDINYRPQVKIPPVIPFLEGMGIQRGYNYFCDNYEKIIHQLLELKVYKQKYKQKQKQKKKEIPNFLKLIEHNRDRLFCEYLPLPNRSLLVIEKSNVGTYVDQTVTGVVDAIRTMTSIDLPDMNFAVRVKENRTVKAISQLAEFYSDWYSSLMAGKHGILRKHVFGSRSDFSFRAVISSLSEQHDYEEIHISWGIGVSVFRVHLTKKLMDLGLTAMQALRFLNKYAEQYHPLLEKLFDDMIQESPHRTEVSHKPGIPVILGRNPSLERGSLQRLLITVIKRDPDIPTISLSVLVLKSFNADFDGDQVNVMLCLDNRTADDLVHLAPHKSTFSYAKPRDISASLSIPKPPVSTIANWMHSPDEPDPGITRLMEQLAAMSVAQQKGSVPKEVKLEE